MTFLADTGDRSGTPPAARLSTLLEDLLRTLADSGYDLGRVLAVPPDITRLHSGSGEVLSALFRILGDRLTEVIPAVGTHAPMTEGEIRRMYPGVPERLFRTHNYRTDVTTLGTIEAAFIEEQSEGKLSFPWPAQISRRIASGDHSLVLSIGQVVPHEVAGMANHAKNIFVGTGGAEAINRSHYLGAVYGMERIMGVADNPVRRVLNRAAQEFTGDLPIVYILTVVGRDTGAHPTGGPPTDTVACSGETPHIVGLFAGDDQECFYQAAELSREHNVITLERPPTTVVVSLDPESYRSTWLGNKAIYRTRKAIADGGELFVYAPGVREFGEDPTIDRLIRDHGYCNTEQVLAAVRAGGEEDLAGNLGTAAHLIHGSTEGRFSVTYAPGHLKRAEIEGVGYHYADPGELAARLRISELRDGWNYVAGREVYYVSQPGLGLWEVPDRRAH